MSVLASGEMVVLTGEDVRRTLVLLSTGIRNGHLHNGIRPHPRALAIQQALAQAAAHAEEATDGQMDDQTCTGAAQSEDSETIDAIEAAELLGTSRRSIYRLIRDGQIDARKHCGTWLLNRQQITELHHERVQHGRH